MAAFGAYAYVIAVAAAAFLLFRQQQLAGQDPSFGRMVAWQALVYALWLPFAALIWLWFRRAPVASAAVRHFVLLGIVAVPTHAIAATFVDIRFSEPGGADLVAMAAARAQLNVLIYSAFAALAVAALFQRKAAEEAEAAAEIARTLDAAGETLAAMQSQRQDHDRLMVATGSSQTMVPLEAVEWFGSAGNYVVVNWQGREGLLRQTLQSLEQRLDPRLFARSHRGTIVNLAKVEGAQSLSDGSWRLTMSTGAELVVSRTYRDLILERLGRSASRP
ncbi:MAG TPA: LytTR family DNA-binding domain-containing protein [Allosphingosinicella sp.]|jgi:DNA-binding LytR/AlgR family response regulator